MISVAGISYTEIRDQPLLLKEYAQECSIAALGQVNPQWEMYEQLQAAGALKAFAVHVNDEFAGFAVMLMWVVPHYGVKSATVESLFVTKAHRGSTAAARLMRFMELTAKVAGCRAILYSAPAGGQLEEVLGKRHARTNSVFCKPLAQLT